MVGAEARALPARRLRVVFLGPPGAGKGTQAARLSAYLRLPRISTGDMLRDAMAQGTALGKLAAPLVENGSLVPDEILMGIVHERLAQPDCDLGYILDGFPRTLGQAEGFDRMEEDSNSELCVINVEVPRGELLRRLSGRRWCPQCQATYHIESNPPRTDQICDNDGRPLIQREDDKEAAVLRRLAEYDVRTHPLIAYYGGRSRLHKLDGHRGVDAVFHELRGILEPCR